MPFCVRPYDLFVCFSATIETCSNNSWSESAEGESKFAENVIIGRE